MFLFKPFYVFWQNISFGLDGMEYRAVATMLIGIYFNIKATANFLIPKAHHWHEKLPYLLIPIMIAFYLWLPHYFRSNYNSDLEYLDKTSLHDRVKYGVSVIGYFTLTYILYTYSRS
jgi:hypothetical protein